MKAKLVAGGNGDVTKICRLAGSRRNVGKSRWVGINKRTTL